MYVKAFVFSIALLANTFLTPAGLFAGLSGESAGGQTAQKSLPKGQITEEGFVMINGIEQWITIKGESSKPAILFLHGGPGSPISPYSDVLYKEWEKDFVIVQWDQRGTGKTYSRNAPEELTPEYLTANPLTVDVMTADGIAVSEYLLKRLSKPKIILFGTSWGSVLGVKMASMRPDLYYAYIGHSQVVDGLDQLGLYDEAYRQAQKRNDKESLAKLDEIVKMTDNTPKKVGSLLRIVKKFERENSTPAPKAWFVPAPSYSNEKDEQHRSDGDDYSFVNLVGDVRFGVQPMISFVRFSTENVEFKIPVYLIQGKEDILTPKEKSKAYFDKITAPKKKYYLVPKAAHGFNQAVLDMKLKVIKGIKIK